MRRALVLRERALGSDHPWVSEALTRLAESASAGAPPTDTKRLTRRIVTSAGLLEQGEEMTGGSPPQGPRQDARRRRAFRGALVPGRAMRSSAPRARGSPPPRQRRGKLREAREGAWASTAGLWPGAAGSGRRAANAVARCWPRQPDALARSAPRRPAAHRRAGQRYADRAGPIRHCARAAARRRLPARLYGVLGSARLLL